MGDAIKNIGKKYSLLALVGVAILSSAPLKVTFASESAQVTDFQAGNEAQITGRNIAFDRKKGNCLSCHQIEGGTLAGTVGPPLMQMKARFPVRELLHEQIADARIRNPATVMPPFGAHGILNAEEIELIIDFLYEL